MLVPRGRDRSLAPPDAEVPGLGGGPARAARTWPRCLNNVNDPSLAGDPARLAQTQADLAQVPRGRERALDAAGLKNMTVGAVPGDLERVGKERRRPARLHRARTADPSLADTARDRSTRGAYIGYRARARHRSPQARATRGARRGSPRSSAAGDTKSALYASLVDKEQQLATMQALQTSNASLVKRRARARADRSRGRCGTASSASSSGSSLGLGLAFLREALDTQVRTRRRSRRPARPADPRPHPRAAALAAQPEPARHGRRARNASTPSRIRILRTNLEFANLDAPAKTIMVTSAVEGEGKSTTVANLAVAIARGGRHVILVDLDLRHPYLRTFFPLAPAGPV